MLAALVALRLCALSQVLLFVAALLVSRAPASVRGFGAAFGLCTACYLVFPLLEDDLRGTMAALPASLTHLVPLFFYLFLRALYEDRPSALPIAPASVAFAVLAIVSVTLSERSLLPLFALQIAKLACVVATLAVVLRDRDADLIDVRRASRPIVATAIIALMALVVIAELVGGFRVEPRLELAGMSAILALAFLSNLAVMRFGAWFAAEPRAPGRIGGTEAGSTRSSVPAPAPAPTHVADATGALVTRLRSAMRDERLYADHDLRVGTLATHLGVPEYRLRRTINGTLGYRNFNQFVNGYRLEEASARLVSDPRTPVLTIALDVGFRSISSFNAAFRARFGSSPGAYCKRRFAGN